MAIRMRDAATMREASVIGGPTSRRQDMVKETNVTTGTRRLLLWGAIHAICAGIPMRTMAADDLPPTGILYSAEDLGRIQFVCRFLDDRGEVIYRQTKRIRCSFQKVLLQMPKPEAAATSLANEEKLFEAEWAKTSAAEKTKIAAQLKKEFADSEESRRYAARERERLSKNNYRFAMLPEVDAVVAGVEATRARIKACQDPECFRTFLKETSMRNAREKADTCTISIFDWTIDFALQGKAWTAVETQSTCNSSTTTTIIRAPDNEHAWEMRTTKVPKPDAPPALCSRELTTQVDSWRPYPGVRLSCSRVTL